MKENYIQLAAFRHDNNISQDELGALLGTSRGFISMIESGKSKLPDDKIELLYDSGHEKFWNMDSLAPAYGRIMALNNFLNENYLPTNNLCSEITDGEDGSVIAKPLLTSEILRDLKYGHTTITEPIANAIVKKWSRVNKVWLLSGEGTIDVANGTEMTIIRDYFIQLTNEIRKLEKEVQSLRKELQNKQ